MQQENVQWLDAIKVWCAAHGFLANRIYPANFFFVNTHWYHRNEICWDVNTFDREVSECNAIQKFKCLIFDKAIKISTKVLLYYLVGLQIYFFSLKWMLVNKKWVDLQAINFSQNHIRLKRPQNFKNSAQRKINIFRLFFCEKQQISEIFIFWKSGKIFLLSLEGKEY